MPQVNPTNHVTEIRGYYAYGSVQVHVSDVTTVAGMSRIDSDALNNNSQGPEDLAPVRKRPDVIVTDGQAARDDSSWRNDDETVAASMLTLANPVQADTENNQISVLYDYYEKENKNGVEDEVVWANSASVTPAVKVEPSAEMSHNGGHLEMFISKEPEDLTRRSPVVAPTDRIIHSSVISRALANGELVNAGFDALHSLEEPHSPPHQRRLNDDVLFADSEIKSEITYQNDNYTTTTLTQVPYDNSSTYTVIANAGSQRYSRQYSASSPNGEYYQDINHFGNAEAYPQNNRRIVYSTSEQATGQVFVERYNVNGRQPVYKVANSVDLPSPDSGIGDGGTPRDPQVIQHANFDYGDPFSSNGLLADALRDSAPSVGSDCDDRTQPTTPLTPLTPGGSTHSGSRKAWDCSRNEPDKFQVPKVYSNYGFRYYLESPISTSQRREDDRITYINKGQFYGITLEYIPDPDRPLKSTTVKSVIMLVFREEKSTEDEQKAWAFWHGRQHSIKQRILDADTKNSAGLIAPIEEVSHNSIAVYWNPLESSGKVNIAVQCLSTDFSSQKGVKGLPLHVQVDTYDEHKDGPPCHRGYCQIKIFCDKGAERKTRDEERRAAKRKMAQSVRSKRIDELYHAACERSEFYSMADLLRQPVLFSPAEDEKVGGPLDLQGFYIEHHDLRFRGLPRNVTPAPVIEATSDVDNGRRTSEIAEPDMVSPPHLFNGSAIKRRRLRPPEYEAILIHVRQDGEDYFTSLYVAPPTVQGLVSAIVEKYKMSAETIRALYRKNRINGAVSRLDDNVLKHYCNEELFHMDITRTDSDGFYDVTFVELDLS